MRSTAILAAVVVSTLSLTVQAEETKDGGVKKNAPRPLRHAHAHNDYRHERPLLDALDQGFQSVEADIYLVNGELLVAHSRFELRRTKTLRSLYLDPLRARVRRNGGKVHRGGREFTLLIDIKDDGEKTYTALHEVLGEYAEMLTSVRDGTLEKRAVRVVISGNRPRQLMAGQKLRYAGVDGRLSDLESRDPGHLLPMISDHWGRNFKWRGKGPMPGAEREKLATVVEKAHGKGRVVRFWATPENRAIWKALHDAGVDLINTDKLAELRTFLSEVERPDRAAENPRKSRD